MSLFRIRCAAKEARWMLSSPSPDAPIERGRWETWIMIMPCNALLACTVQYLEPLACVVSLLPCCIGWEHGTSQKKEEEKKEKKPHARLALTQRFGHQFRRRWNLGSPFAPAKGPASVAQWPRPRAWLRHCELDAPSAKPSFSNVRVGGTSHLGCAFANRPTSNVGSPRKEGPASQALGS